MELHPLELMLSLILTWGIGLAPPLLIRFKFKGVPMGKWPAIGTCAVFWLLNVMLSTALGSQSKTHGALTLVAFVSYWILTKRDKVLTEADQLVLTAEHIKENNDSRDILTGAAWNGDLAKVKLLLEGGADVNQANSQGQTALDLARARKDKQLINMLLGYGANPYSGKLPTIEVAPFAQSKTEPRSNPTFALNRLGGWERVFLVASVTWLILGSIVYYLALNGSPRFLELVPSFAFGWGRDLFALPNPVGDLPVFPVFSVLGFFSFLVAPVVLSWVGLWVVVHIVRWVRAGFQR